MGVGGQVDEAALYYHVAFDFLNAKYLWHLRGFVEYMQLLGEKRNSTTNYANFKHKNKGKRH